MLTDRKLKVSKLKDEPGSPDLVEVTSNLLGNSRRNNQAFESSVQSPSSMIHSAGMDLSSSMNININNNNNNINISNDESGADYQIKMATVRRLCRQLCDSDRWKLELRLFWHHKWKFFLGVAMQFIHSTMTNIAYFRHVQGERLRDMGFEIFPELGTDKKWINEWITFTIIPSTILTAFLPFFYRKPPMYMATAYVRTLSVMGICLILRCASFLATSLPGPAAHCQPGSETYRPPETTSQILFEIDVLHGCGDLIFSSHTTLVMTLVLSVHIYLKYFVSRRVYLTACFVIWSLFFILVCLIVAARNHYSVDVLVALYTTPLVYHASYSLFSDDSPKEVLALVGRNTGIYASDSIV